MGTTPDVEDGILGFRQGWMPLGTFSTYMAANDVSGRQVQAVKIIVRTLDIDGDIMYFVQNGLLRCYLVRLDIDRVFVWGGEGGGFPLYT